MIEEQINLLKNPTFTLTMKQRKMFNINKYRFFNEKNYAILKYIIFIIRNYNLSFNQRRIKKWKKEGAIGKHTYF